MTLDALCKQYPLLYHMATADALPQIEKYGLLSTQATLDLLGITGDRREELISRRRPTDVVLQCKTYGKFVLRDQIPMRDGALAKCLVGMSPPGVVQNAQREGLHVGVEGTRGDAPWCTSLSKEKSSRNNP